MSNGNPKPRNPETQETQSPKMSNVNPSKRGTNHEDEDEGSREQERDIDGPAQPSPRSQ